MSMGIWQHGDKVKAGYLRGLAGGVGMAGQGSEMDGRGCDMSVVG